MAAEHKAKVSQYTYWLPLCKYVSLNKYYVLPRHIYEYVFSFTITSFNRAGKTEECNRTRSSESDLEIYRNIGNRGTVRPDVYSSALILHESYGTMKNVIIDRGTASERLGEILTL